jgi:hypothetical protein
MFNVSDPRHLVQPQATEVGDEFDLCQVSMGYEAWFNCYLTHCWIVSTSSLQTPMRLVPRRCQAVSLGKFWIMMPLSTVSSVSTSLRIL